MTSYKSTSSKKSGVIAYHIGKDFITVKFRDKDQLYTYSYSSAGVKHVEKMKLLARASKGLSTYIAQNQPGFVMV
jgi:hypothetical protein